MQSDAGQTKLITLPEVLLRQPGRAKSDARFLVLFDGVCNFCSGWVKFIATRDHAGRFLFASLQSEIGREILTSAGMNPDKLESVAVLTADRLLLRSDAGIAVLSNLGGRWSWTRGMKIIPRFIRDFLYNLIARNRYRLFGQRDACMMPTDNLRERFLS